MLNKAGRAKLAKDTINIFIPHVLKTNPRARKGVQSSEVIHYVPNREASRRDPTSADHTTASKPLISSTLDSQPSSIEKVPEGPNEPIDAKSSSTSTAPQSPPSRPKIRVIQSDTFDAVHSLLSTSSQPGSRIAALNMCSTYSPGGGVLNGSLAQEETLCMRSTLYPSLSPSYYRLPELSCIYSPEILVFRGSDMKDLPKAEWFFTDVISIAALRQPELKWVVDGDKKRLVYENEVDREMMIEKVRCLIQVLREKGVKRVVLGALGCGAYGNPPEEVARIFKRVIIGDRKRGGVEGVDEIVFAIFDKGENLKAFSEVFADVTEE